MKLSGAPQVQRNVSGTTPDGNVHRLNLATGNWRDALLAPILSRYNYQTLAIHELSALFAALGVNVFARLKPGARGPMDCTHQCLPSPDIDTWNLLLLNAIEAGLNA